MMTIEPFVCFSMKILAAAFETLNTPRTLVASVVHPRLAHLVS